MSKAVQFERASAASASVWSANNLECYYEFKLRCGWRSCQWHHNQYSKDGNWKMNRSVNYGHTTAIISDNPELDATGSSDSDDSGFWFCIGKVVKALGFWFCPGIGRQYEEGFDFLIWPFSSLNTGNNNKIFVLPSNLSPNKGRSWCCLELVITSSMILSRTCSSRVQTKWNFEK